MVERLTGSMGLLCCGRNEDNFLSGVVDAFTISIVGRGVIWLV